MWLYRHMDAKGSYYAEATWNETGAGCGENGIIFVTSQSQE